MASQQQSKQAARIPPDVPADASISPRLTQYLRTFALWCRDGFAEQMRNNEAVPGVLMRAWDTPAGANPKIFLIRVNAAGAISAEPIGIGGDATRRSVGSS